MSNPKVFRIDPDGPPGIGLKPISVMTQANIFKGQGVETGTFDYTDPTGQFICGIWESTPCIEYIPSYPCDEFCYLLSGEIIVTDTSGRAQSFKAGEGFMVLRGLQCTYEMVGVTRKYSIMFENKLPA